MTDKILNLDKNSRRLAKGAPYDIESEINNLILSLSNVNIDYDKIKNAYPNNGQYVHVPGQHNTVHWLQAVKDIYYREKNGATRVDAIRQTTRGWNPMETFDFLNWLKFYEEGAHLKYKMAQWYVNDNLGPGYFLHVKPDPAQPAIPPVSGKDIDYARDAAADEMSLSEKKQIIEKQRQKIIGRLDSAEKLLRSQEGQLFAGKELESLMEAIYALKKKVQLVNKLSTATKLYEDMIIREANILNRKGFIKAADMLHSLAQPLTPASPAPPNLGSGSVGGLPSMGPGMAQNPPESAPNEMAPLPTEEQQPEGIKEFLDRMETANFTTNEEDDQDTLDVKLDDLSVEDLIVEAQIPPIDEPMTDEPRPAPLNPRGPFRAAPSLDTPKPAEMSAAVTEEPLEVSEEDVPDTEETKTPISNFDSKLDKLFDSVTVADVVSELESLSKIFKTREIPRRLSRADMMLDSLGLAPFFPALSEAQNKSLEANNYIATRVDDILAKLRGSLSAKEIDLQGDNVGEHPELSQIKNKLKSDEDKETARKNMRKELGTPPGQPAKETPEVELAEDLGAPVAPAIKPLV